MESKCKCGHMTICDISENLDAICYWCHKPKGMTVKEYREELSNELNL